MHELTENLPEGVYDDDIVLFLKDTAFDKHFLAKPRPLLDVIRIASIRGFACFSPPYQDQSLFHETETLLRFKMDAGYSRLDRDSEDNFHSKYEDLENWSNDMGFSFTGPLTPVCYQGNFAATVDQIVKRGKIWKNIERSLSRGDNIEEGHFAERSWAELLSAPFSKAEIGVLFDGADEILNSEEDKEKGFWGALSGCSS